MAFISSYERKKGLQKKTLDKKDKVDFKIYDVTTCLTIHILPNISQSKGNQTMNLAVNRI